MKTVLPFLRVHTFYIALIAVLLIFGRAYIREHDQRIVDDLTVKRSAADTKTLQAQIQSLQSAIASTNQKAVQAQANLQRVLAAIKTPAQAIAALPSVSDLPLNAHPTGSGLVEVDPVALYADLNECAQNKVALAACQANLISETDIDTAKDKQLADANATIAALKKKPSFWKRVTGTLKAVGVGIGIGVLVAHGL